MEKSKKNDLLLYFISSLVDSNCEIFSCRNKFFVIIKILNFVVIFDEFFIVFVYVYSYSSYYNFDVCLIYLFC